LQSKFEFEVCAMSKRSLWSAVCGLISLCLFAAVTMSAQDVLTYHADNLRTGWFSAETQLTPSNVSPSTFGLLQTVQLDGRVDGEPLIVTGQTIQGQGVHDVVYVATEVNGLYAIDAESGAILWHNRFGMAVPYQLKNNDDNVYPYMGILSTPVIDRNAGLIYFVSDSLSGGGDVFRLHAALLTTGLDAVPATTIAFSEQLSDGTMWTSLPKYQLQRPALLEANGSIYVAFGSNGDIVPGQSRGTIMRFDATTLLPLTGQLNNKLHVTTNQFYLSSIWASGFGPSTDASGDIFFPTGNSDPRRPSYSQAFNRPDSIMRMSSDLLTLNDSFTPYNYFQLDQADLDVGSGGMLLLPDQPGSIPHLAIAGGKDGRAFLVNRDSLGGYVSGGPDRLVQAVNMGSCWCGPAYYLRADGIGRVLTGGGNGVISWQVQTSPSVQLVQEGSTGPNSVYGLPDDGGVIPVVSSNGTTDGTAIVWFVEKPATSSDHNPGTPVTLKAYAASNLNQALIAMPAGTWVHARNSNANVVPTISNGRVYVASNQQLQIFGLTNDNRPGLSRKAEVLAASSPDVVTCPVSVAPLAAVKGSSAPVHDFYGTVCEASSSQFRLTLRTGRAVSIDIGTGHVEYRPMLLTPGRPVHVRASIGKDGVAHAEEISASHLVSAGTPADR
jgi:hypothetical protein